MSDIRTLSRPRWIEGTERFWVTDVLGGPATYDCENGRIHSLDGKEIEATSERLAAILASLGPTHDELIEKLKAVRDRRLDSGCAFGPVKIQSDTESIVNLTGKYVRAMYKQSVGEPYSFNWSLGGGKFTKLGLPEIIAIGAVIDNYKQACYDRYGELYGRILAGEDLLKIEADLETGWPE